MVRVARLTRPVILDADDTSGVRLLAGSVPPIVRQWWLGLTQRGSSRRNNSRRSTTRKAKAAPLAESAGSGGGGLCCRHFGRGVNST
jgi:hypothetical protein